MKFIMLALLAAALGVTAASSVARAGELIQNGGFEAGDFGSAWIHGAGSISGPLDPDWADHRVVPEFPYTGNFSALLGFKYHEPQQRRFAYMYHDVTIPSNISRATLYFRFRQQGYDGAGYDPFRVEVRDLSDNTLASVVVYSLGERNGQFKDSGWIQDDGVGPAGCDMTAFAGQTVRVYFRQENTSDNRYETWTFVDDVSFVYRKYVDLIVDGNGDDSFSDVGSGNGGYFVRSGEHGETVAYLLEIENEGLDVDSYTTSISLPAGWVAIISYEGSDYAFPWTTPVMPAGSTITVQVRLTIPPGELLDGYSSVVDAISTSFGNRFDSVTLGTNVVPAAHLTDLAIDANGFGIIDSRGGGGTSIIDTRPDTVITYDIELLNAGTQADSFGIWYAPESPLTAVVEEGATVHQGAFSTGSIAADATVSFTLRVTIPAGLLDGNYVTNVYAKSLTDTLKKDGVTAVAHVIASKVDIVIAGSGDDIIDPTGSGFGGSGTIAGIRGNDIYFPFVLQNEGGVVDSFTLSWSKPPGNWTAVIFDGVSNHATPWTTPVIAPYSEIMYFLVVSIPQNASLNTYTSILDAVSLRDGNARESVTANTSVVEGIEVDIVIDGNGDGIYGPLGTGLGGSSVQTVGAGDTASFTIELQNESGEDLFDLSWTAPAGWQAVIGDSTSSMRGITAGTYTMEVRVPADSPGGSFEIVIDGVKANKPFFIDSAKGIVVVAPPRIVDATIDGVGDGVFGALGTGAGGFSSRSTIAGRTVTFMLELQNEGPDPESYTVSWNGFVGWTATLEGSPSPYATGIVAPGTSEFYTFEVMIPLTAPVGDYDFVMDIVSAIDASNVESVTARVHINDFPSVDLVIDGDGAFDTAPAGSGEGGRAMLFGAPGTITTAVLEVHNRGGFPDSFEITWSEPAGWPAGSVLISDGVTDYNSPFMTAEIGPGSSLSFAVIVAIPADAGLRSSFVVDGSPLSSDFDDSVLLEIATGAFIAGTVFNDTDHDGSLDTGEQGWGGVRITLSDSGGWITVLTDGTGAFYFEVPSGTAREIVEHNPSGFISLSPDTVSIGGVATGDTVRVDFADVRGPILAPNNDVSAPAGGFADCSHTITVGTSGQATINVVLPPGWVEVMYRDNNEDGMLDGGDTRLTSADLYLDPDVPGSDRIFMIMRVFVPGDVPVGTVENLTVTIQQEISGTPISAQMQVIDRVLILASASGVLQLVKDVDLDQAHPGDVITYTISFTNTGVEDVREIEIIDPLSDAVDFEMDAFGPGQDVAWVRDGSTVYLTADPGDADEAMLEAPDRRLRVILSRQNPYVLPSGAAGCVIYRVRVK